MSLRIGLWSALILTAVGVAAAAPPDPAQIEFFETKVRPVLAGQCYECHGPEKQKAGMRVDSLAGLLRGGELGPAIVPGKPDESRLIIAVSYEDPDLMMPPRDMLEESVVADLRRWIGMGAPWPGADAEDQAVPTPGPDGEFDLEARRAAHWAWQPIRDVEPPEIAGADRAGTPIDAFILARLDEAGLSAAPRADRGTLLRRVYFDLIGLPPEPEDLKAFLADDSPDALAKVIDGLLDSPRFGERWGRHWLDLMRYAETYGHEQDYPIRDAWRYRDYVIRAFNADVPYDRFVTEHLAGDLMPDPRRNPEEGFNEAIIGTGFWNLSQGTHGPVDVRQDEADRIDNQIDVMSKALLGMTVACARCHDHKFDAISTKDYYALAGFLQSSRRQEAYLDPGGRIREKSSELKVLRDYGNLLMGRAMREAARPATPSAGDYLRGAREVMHGRWTPADGDIPLRNDILFEEFDSGAGASWFITGGTFGELPVRTDGGRGHLDTALGDDRAHGTIVSKPFLIERRFIRIEVAGSDLAEKTFVRLALLSGEQWEPVRTASGRGDDSFRAELWDVAEFAGRTARIEIVDDDPGYGGTKARNGTDVRGAVMVDRIAFLERAETHSRKRSVPAVAAELGLDEGGLERWVTMLNGPAPDAPDHPLHAWKRLAMHNQAADSEQFARSLEALRAETAALDAKIAAERETYVLYEDFNDGGWGEWEVTGHAFGPAPTDGRNWLPGSAADPLASPGVAHSGVLSGRLEGALRSPTFEITHDRIHYRMHGRDTQLRLVIDGFVICEFNALLFADVFKDVRTDGEFTWVEQARDVRKYKGHRAYLEILDRGHGETAIDEIRFSDTDPAVTAVSEVTRAALGSDSPGSTDALAELYNGKLRQAMQAWSEDGAGPDGPGGELLRLVVRADLMNTGAPEAEARLRDLAAHLGEMEREIPRPVTVVAMTDGTPEDERVFIRGNHNTPGDLVHRRLLEAVAGEDQPPISPGEGSGRLELARRILDDANPLASRVAVNRLWHHLFGAGIVASVDNFGVLGEAPSHPELLDWLATRFREEGWSVKRMIRSMMLSDAYQMSSRPQDERAEAADPKNRLLHRMNVQRLEAEAIRDSVLAAAGNLNTTMYGEPVEIYVTDFMDGRNKPKSGPLDGDGRRTIYLSVRRNYISPMLLTFDMPVPDSTVGRRNVSNVPAQALILMNDPFVLDQAGKWAKKIAAMEEGGEVARINEIYLRALSRLPNEEEILRSMAFLAAQRDEYGIPKGGGLEDERLWADLCHVIFTLKEFIFVG